MKFAKKILITFVGVMIKSTHGVFRIRKNTWVFGSQSGKGYADNSKYFFEYVVSNHPEINSIWLTRSKKTIKSLRARNLKVYDNLSFKGIWSAIIAGVAVFCTSRDDLWFVYSKKNRKIINLWHGMPMKKIVFDYPGHSSANRTLKDEIWSMFVAGIEHKDVSLIASTSDFFSSVLKSSFRNNNVVVTGQPRTDVFFKWNKNEIKTKLGLNEYEKIITYMPTHRAYGKGQLNPLIFNNNTKALEYFNKNNMKIIWKFHRNMISSYQKTSVDGEVIVDMTMDSVDPQELLFVTDILITDYSSCYIDFLLLKRPIIFYFYDDYESNDNELYYNPKEHNVGCIAKDESELLEKITICSYKSDVSIEYHKHIDMNSSARTFNEIIKL